MQELTYPHTFNSYDASKHRVLFAPHGPDPVFFGIRGENVDSLVYAAKLIKSDEKPIGHLVFKSNQGTDDHLQNELNVYSLRPFLSGTIVGTVSKEPKMGRGGHVNFFITKDGVEISCYVYKPTGMTKHAMCLIRGDVIRVGGGIRRFSPKHGRTLNVEFFEILKLQKKTILVNPSCTKCNKRMKSKGRRQGFECSKCGKKATRKFALQIPRQIKRQLILPVSSAHRHLTRPHQRIGVVNTRTKFEDSTPWFSEYKN
jgi:tRNA(Ile2)-agmatinylcytidine synthase